MFDPPETPPLFSRPVRGPLKPPETDTPGREEYHEPPPGDGPGWAVVAVPLLGLMVLGVIALVFFLRLIS
jgi:hypothetical protein